MTLTTEFEVFDKVFYFKEDGIKEGLVREVSFPPYTRLSLHPKSEDIQYGLLTMEELDFLENSGTFESRNVYDWRRANQIGRTPQDLLKKTLKLYEKFKT